MRDLVCSCERSFQVEVPENVDLGADQETKSRILDGTFLSFTCPHCGRRLKPEFPIRITWGDYGLDLQVLPATEKAAFLLGEKIPSDVPSGSAILFGYSELAERIQILDGGLEPLVVEALKYYLLAKAEEADPEADLSVRFFGIGDKGLEFHIYGLKDGEVAKMVVPKAVYERTRQEASTKGDSEPFVTLKKAQYLSVNSLLASKGEEA